MQKMIILIGLLALVLFLLFYDEEYESEKKKIEKSEPIVEKKKIEKSEPIVEKKKIEKSEPIVEKKKIKKTESDNEDEEKKLRESFNFSEKGKAVYDSLVENIKVVKFPKKNRWPLLVWTFVPKSKALARAYAQRGIMPLFNGTTSLTGRGFYLPIIQEFQKEGVKIILLPQSLVNGAYYKREDANHLPPAKPAIAKFTGLEPHRDFTCLAWMYENPLLNKHKKNVKEVAQFFKDAKVEITAFLMDFESGVHLRNGAEKKARVKASLKEALKCPRCMKRFKKSQISTPKKFSKEADKARAYNHREIFIKPLRTVFPKMPVGNYFTYPIKRLKPVKDMFPAYGWENSGLDIAMPRVYFTPGWKGAGTSVKKMNWNIVRNCVLSISEVAGILKKDEKLIPWFAWLFNNKHAKRAGYKKLAISSFEAYKEMAIHVMLRGAETIAIFAPQGFDEGMQEAYKTSYFYKEKQTVVNVKPIQEGWAEVLKYNDFIRDAKVLNLKIDGEYNKLDRSTNLWSGYGTRGKALIRTVTFGKNNTQKIKLFGKKIKLPFNLKGQFFWVKRNGKIINIKEE